MDTKKSTPSSSSSSSSSSTSSSNVKKHSTGDRSPSERQRHNQRHHHQQGHQSSGGRGGQNKSGGTTGGNPGGNPGGSSGGIRGTNERRRDRNYNNSKQFNSQKRGGNQQDRGPIHRPQRKNHPPRRPLTLHELHHKHIELLEIHNQARKRYFEFYNKVNDQQRTKLEREFYQAGENLRVFEDQLTPYHKAALFKAVHNYKLDTTYSENHQLSTEGDPVVEQSFPDPHLTHHQLNRASLKEDTEESMGTMEDYLKLKNLPTHS